MSYISLSDKDKKEMLAKIGISSTSELFLSIPENLKLNRRLQIPDALSELDLFRHFEDIAKKNTYGSFLSFLGAGAYRHFIPAIVDYLSSRGEFVSPYTPYQPEISQGTLQTIFEFQTLICQLTGLDIANASLYDGASGAAEAVLMANRLKKKNKILISKTLHPQYRSTINTYTQNLDFVISEIGYDKTGRIDHEMLLNQLDQNTAAVIVQSPNFFGVVEDLKNISSEAHKYGALSIAVAAEALSLGLFEPPGKLGVDIVTGDAQSFGMPLSFGGPFLGFMACSHEYIRQLPGRIVGQTKDIEGIRGFVLTLSTREQHIRRERATSNICTNQALCLVRATIFLETLGKKGLKDMAWQNLQKANYTLEKLTEIEGVKLKFSGPIFNEFTLELNKSWEKVKNFLESQSIIGGLGLEKFYPELQNCVLVCVTELCKKEDIDRLAAALKTALSD